MTLQERGDGGKKPIELGELRMKLDQMTERVSSRFKDRLRFPQNPTVYLPDGVHVRGRSGISFLEFSIEKLEDYHASLGRYDYSDQHPVLGINLPSSSAERVIAQTQLPDISVNIGKNLISFYQGLVPRYCEPGDDPETYGETVYVDADLIQLMHERINMGRFVADVKGRNDPSIYQLETDDEILAKLKDKEREELLIKKVRKSAEVYQYSPDMAEEAFRWMIDRTIDVEIAYIRQAERPDDTGLAGFGIFQD